MAAAGYIDETPEPTDSGNTVTSGIQDADDLSPDEIDQVNQYIAFLKSRRKE